MAFQTTTILSLPFDVTTNIVQYLPLKDALHFSAISTTAFDAVYYTFAHRTILNFASCLDERGCIQLTDKDILSVMHAHTRAIEICNFALPPTFKSFDDLKFYFEAYLRGKGNGKLDSIHTPHEWVTNPLTREVYYGFMNTLDSFDPTGRVTTTPHPLTYTTCIGQTATLTILMNTF